MDVQEIKKQVEAFESEVTKLVNEFEAKTEVKITSLYIYRAGGVKASATVTI